MVDNSAVQFGLYDFLSEQPPAPPLSNSSPRGLCRQTRGKVQSLRAYRCKPHTTTFVAKSKEGEGDDAKEVVVRNARRGEKVAQGPYTSPLLRAGDAALGKGGGGGDGAGGGGEGREHVGGGGEAAEIIKQWAEAEAREEKELKKKHGRREGGGGEAC